MRFNFNTVATVQINLQIYKMNTITRHYEKNPIFECSKITQTNLSAMMSTCV